MPPTPPGTSAPHGLSELLRLTRPDLGMLVTARQVNPIHSPTESPNTVDATGELSSSILSEGLGRRRSRSAGAPQDIQLASGFTARVRMERERRAASVTATTRAAPQVRVMVVP